MRVMTAHQATTAAIAAALTPAQTRALRDAGRDQLIQDSRGIVRGTAGTVQPATVDALLGRSTALARTLQHKPLIRLDGRVGDALRQWRPTELGAAVLARLAGQDGAR